MTPREIILANIERTNPPRPGLTFSGGRANDMVWASLDPSPEYRQKRWIDLLNVGIDVFQCDQPALYDMPALAGKLRRHGRCLWSPVDIQKVLPTGNRAFIEAETLRLCRTFEGGLILKDYPDLASLNLDPEWDAWAYDTIAKFCGLGS